jgi:hypothetical protein
MRTEAGMDNFQVIYKILRTLEAAMDLAEFEMVQIGYENMGVSKERWTRYMEMLIDSGYIKGIQVHSFIGGGVNVTGTNPRITLKGLEYLNENSTMQRLYKAAKGIIELIP